MHKLFFGKAAMTSGILGHNNPKRARNIPDGLDSGTEV